MTGTIKVEDIIFEGDLPEVSTSKSLKFWHKFIYQTDVDVKLVTQLDVLQFSYNNDKLCIALKCDCTNAFSGSCCQTNFGILCKVIMTAIDGTYPLADSPVKTVSRCVDGMHDQFCSDCFTGRLLCRCLERRLSKKKFLAELIFFPACGACKVLSKHCECNFNFFKLYRFYQKLAADGKILRKMNEIKRIAYLASSNVSVCFNCSRISRFCMCEPAFQIHYK